MVEELEDDKQPIIIKKYATRRLYNTEMSTYVTLDHLLQMVKDGVDFVVYDTKSGKNITRSILTQIVFEEESKKGQQLLPTTFLRHLISFYGDSMQDMVPQYLELSMDSFARQQEQMRNYMTETFDDFFPFSQFEEIGKQNMANFQNALKVMGAFNSNPAQKSEIVEKQLAEKETPTSDTVNDLKSKLEDVHAQIASLAKNIDAK